MGGGPSVYERATRLGAATGRSRPRRLPTQPRPPQEVIAPSFDFPTQCSARSAASAIEKSAGSSDSKRRLSPDTGCAKPSTAACNA